jgi:hypothetical protein
MVKKPQKASHFLSKQLQINQSLVPFKGEKEIVKPYLGWARDKLYHLHT